MKFVLLQKTASRERKDIHSQEHIHDPVHKEGHSLHIGTQCAHHFATNTSDRTTAAQEHRNAQFRHKHIGSHEFATTTSERTISPQPQIADIYLKQSHFMYACGKALRQQKRKHNSFMMRARPHNSFQREGGHTFA